MFCLDPNIESPLNVDAAKMWTNQKRKMILICCNILYYMNSRKLYDVACFIIQQEKNRIFKMLLTVLRGLKLNSPIKF